MEHLVSAGVVCEIDEIPYTTLDYWCKTGVIRPVVPAGGKGRHRMFRAVEVLAVLVGRGLRAKGHSLRVAGDAMDFVMQHSEQELQAAFKQGRRYLLLCCDEVATHLMSREDIENSRVLRMLSKATGTEPVAMNLEGMLARILEKIERPAEEMAPALL